MKPKIRARYLFRTIVFLMALCAISRVEIDATILANGKIKGTATGSHGPAKHLREAVGSFNAVSIRVDNSYQHQVMEGFGASLNSEVYGTTDYLTASQRARALDALYNQVKIRTGQAPAILEAPSTGDDFYTRRTNDDGNPLTLNWAGFNTTAADGFKRKVVDMVSAESTAGIFPDVHINIRWASPWLLPLRDANYTRFLDECAEQVLAGVTYWKNTYGQEPRYAMLFNEPTSGNGELNGGSTQQIIDIIKRSGERLRAAGFTTVKFVVASQETEQISLNTASAIVADAQARQFVGAFSYHPYPYGSTYSFIPNILSSSGTGNPSPEKIGLRRQLRDLGKQYGIPLWMNEVSNGFYGNRSPDQQGFDVVRGRAIHIHDELTYADAAAFYGMLSLWSTRANLEHFGSKIIADNPDNIVLVDQDTDKVMITGMGYAIGHYARWIKKGAVRIEASSSDALLQVTAFRDDAQSRLVLVAINNDSSAKELTVSLSGLSLSGNLTGEQSTAGSYWHGITPFSPVTATSFTLTLPSRSVTTISGAANAAGASRLPKITSASVKGKKLFVMGADFEDGAVVLVNGEQQKTLIDTDNPTTRLIAKKAGNKIAIGQTVTLQVKNPDGSSSDEFPFLRSEG
jgi:O-glycosyl hydrolase